MTIETQTGGGEPIVKSGPYSGNGVTDTFDYDFQIQDQAELLVTRQNADDTETVLVVTTDYTVSGVGDDTGGQITLVDAANDLPTGTSLVIQYNGDFNQSTDYSNQGSIQLGALEDALDKVTMHLQALKDLSDRALKVDAFSSTDVDTLMTNVAAIAAIESNITALAAIVSDVSAVAAVDSGDLQTIASLEADITALVAGGSVTLSGIAIDGTSPVTLTATDPEFRLIDDDGSFARIWYSNGDLFMVAD